MMYNKTINEKQKTSMTDSKQVKQKTRDANLVYIKDLHC